MNMRSIKNFSRKYFVSVQGLVWVFMNYECNINSAVFLGFFYTQFPDNINNLIVKSTIMCG